MCYQHAVAIRLLSTEEGREEGAQFNGTNPPSVILAAVMSCPLRISRGYDMLPAYSSQPSAVHRRGKRGRCSVQWHQPTKGDSCCSDELPAKNKHMICYQHTVASLLLSTEEEERKVPSSMAPTTQVISCTLRTSSAYDVPPTNSCQPSAAHG